MKATVKLFGIAAAVAVIITIGMMGLSLTSCDNGSKPDKGGNNTGGGTPTVTGVSVTPQNVTVDMGETQEFSATVSGDNSPAQTVTWTVAGNAKAGTKMDGKVLTVADDETAETLTVKATSTVDNAKSGTATVTVRNPGLDDFEGTITISPATATVGMELTATYSGSETVSFQWKKDGENVGTPSTTNPNKLTPDGAGAYTVTVSLAGYNSKDSTNTVTVSAGSSGTTPVITIGTQPEAATVTTEGSITGSLTVAASVTEGGTPAYQWYSNDSDSNTGGSAVSGETIASFAIPAALTAGTYYYFCEVSATGAESVRSNVATVTVTVAFTDIDDLNDWLKSAPANTAATSYAIKLNNISDFGGDYYTNGSLGNALYTNRTKYVSLDLSGSSVTSIGDDAFRNCTGLTSVTIPGSVTSIGMFAFAGCTGLTSIDIPNSVTTIDNLAFSGCTGLTGVTVDPNNPNLTSDGGIVYNKAKTEIVVVPPGISGSVTIPDSVTSIDDAFRNCISLTSVTIPDSVTIIGNSAFNGCTGLTSVTIGSGVTTIGERAFWYCTGLTSVTIPDNVTTIGEQAFYNCTGLTSVTIGSGVTSIDQNAFWGCTSLTGVTIHATTPPTLSNANAFANTNNCPIYVPAGSVAAYKAADGWKSYSISAIQ